MKGADIVYFEARDSQLVDTHSFEYTMPTVDACQDWTLISASKEGGRIRFEASRALDTGDEQDWKLEDDEQTADGHHFIAAWGNTPSVMYHGEAQAKGRIVLFGTHERHGVALPPDTRHGDLLREDKFEQPLPAQKSSYDFWCSNLAAAMGVDGETPLHVVAFEPKLWPGTGHLVHHWLVFGYYQENCAGDDGGMVLIWSPGMPFTSMPDQAGIRLFGDGGFKSFHFETHYNNPKQLSGVKDKSGIRVHYTATLRPHDVGVLQLGDPRVRLLGRSLPRGWSKQRFGCTGLTAGFDHDHVTVFLQALHVHGTGERIEQKIVRDGKVVRSDAVEVFDFSQSGAVNPLSTGRGYELRKGDDVIIDCYYRVPEGGAAPKWGLGTDDEMCLTYLSYYPKQQHLFRNGACDVAAVDDGSGVRGTYLGQQLLSSWHDSGRRFGMACDGSNAPPAWSAKLRLALLGAASIGVLGAAWMLMKRQEGSEAKEVESGVEEERCGILEEDGKVA